jgi:hypothetical protein
MSTRRLRNLFVLILVIGLVGIGSRCKNGTHNTNEKGGAAKPKLAKTGNEGTISGSIAYAGPPVTPKKIDTSADPVCGQKNPNMEAEDNKVANGKLANVFVYIKEGTLADSKKISAYSFDIPSEPVVLDQSGCHYVPHVMGIMANQTLKITNSDPTTHNIHPSPKNNDEFNQGQSAGAAPIEKKFPNSEQLIPVKCNQHPWMKSYIGVMKHPFFAVSAADGSFTIKDVPPGTYTVVAWHEGGAEGTSQTKQVKVDAKGTATADFSFGGAATATEKSPLEMMPALVIPAPGHH